MSCLISGCCRLPSLSELSSNNTRQREPGSGDAVSPLQVSKSWLVILGNDLATVLRIWVTCYKQLT